MLHLRTEIADAIVTKLAAIAGFADEGKVKRGRASAIPQELLPCFTVTWGESGETAERRASAGPDNADGYDRFLPMSIIVHVRDADAELEFDRLCMLVEPLMEVDMTLGGFAVQLSLQQSRLYVDPRTGFPLGAGSLNYQVFYKTLASDPSVAAL